MHMIVLLYVIYCDSESINLKIKMEVILEVLYFALNLQLGALSPLSLPLHFPLDSLYFSIY